MNHTPSLSPFGFLAKPPHQGCGFLLRGLGFPRPSSSSFLRLRRPSRTSDFISLSHSCWRTSTDPSQLIPSSRVEPSCERKLSRCLSSALLLAHMFLGFKRFWVGDSEEGGGEGLGHQKRRNRLRTFSGMKKLVHFIPFLQQWRQMKPWRLMQTVLTWIIFFHPRNKRRKYSCYIRFFLFLFFLFYVYTFLHFSSWIDL